MVSKEWSDKSSEFCCYIENSFILDLHLAQINVRQVLFDKGITKAAATQGIHTICILKSERFQEHYGDFAASHLSETTFVGSFAKYTRKHLIQLQMRFPVATALCQGEHCPLVSLFSYPRGRCQVKLTLNTAKE